MKPIKKLNIVVPKSNLKDKKIKERPPYVSASQMEKFMTCQHSYEISYYRGVKTEGSKYTEIGRKVHKALEEFFHEDHYPQIEPDMFPYIKAVDELLRENGDEIIETEKEINFEIDGNRVHGFVDAITKKGYILDFKVTSSPSRLKNGLPYQLPIYKLALEEMGYGSLKPAYILLKRNAALEFVGDKKGKAEMYAPNITKGMMKEIKKNLSSILGEMDRSWKSGVFPYKTGEQCKNCFVSHYCKFYNGRF